MQVQQIIQASADVLTITKLSPGDVYKRVEESSYGASDVTLRFGVVRDVMNNGSDAAVTALEYVNNYNSIAASIKVFNGAKPVAIFPATPSEFRAYLTDLRAAADRGVETALEGLRKAEQVLSAVKAIEVQAYDLRTPEVSTQTLPAPTE